MKMDVKPTMDSRSVNQYILSLIEDSLIDNDKLKDSKNNDEFFDSMNT